MQNPLAGRIVKIGLFNPGLKLRTKSVQSTETEVKSKGLCEIGVDVELCPSRFRERRGNLRGKMWGQHEDKSMVKAG